MDNFLTLKNPQEKSRIRVNGPSVTTNLPGLKIGSEATERVSETEAVQKVMERLLKTQAEFRVVELRMKIKDC